MASQAALDGISANGLRWQKSIVGAADHAKEFGRLSDKINEGTFEKSDAPLMEAAARGMAKAFRKVVTDYECEDAIGYLEEETIGDCPEVYRDNAVEWMNELYDWADFNRVLVR